MREFLKGLELDKEVIDKIMAEHGKHLNSIKEQADTYQKEIEGYKSTIDELNKKVDESNKTLENLQTVTNENKNLKAQLQMSESNVKKEFSKFVTSEVMSKVNDDNDFTKALEDYKKENPQYFGETVIKKVQTSPNLNTGEPKSKSTNDIMNDILRSAKKED